MANSHIPWWAKRSADKSLAKLGRGSPFLIMKNFRYYIARLKFQIKELLRLRHQNYFKIGILVFLITLLSFGIGYLIGRDWTPAPIIIEKIENSN